MAVSNSPKAHAKSQLGKQTRRATTATTMLGVDGTEVTAVVRTTITNIVLSVHVRTACSRAAPEDRHARDQSGRATATAMMVIDFSWAGHGVMNCASSCARHALNCFWIANESRKAHTLTRSLCVYLCRKQRVRLQLGWW